MKKTILNQFILFGTIVYGCICFTSCSNKPMDTATEDISLPKRMVSANNSDLFNEIDEDDIPDIEDDFSLLLAEVHNDALDYFFEHLNGMHYTIFTHTEAQEDSIMLELAGQYAYEFAHAYNMDTTGFYLFADVSEDEVQEYLEENASDELQLYLRVIDTLCNAGNFSALSGLYGTYGELSDDKERLLLKSCIQVAQYSYNYWISTNYDATSFWPEDLMVQYQYPENPPLFTDSPREINWNRVAQADGFAILRAMTIRLLAQLIVTSSTAGINWLVAGVGISISAAHASIEAFLKENETCTIEVLNTNHAYCYEHDNVIYNFFEDKYQSYGENYFINNWNGRFYFMVDNF